MHRQVPEGPDARRPPALGFAPLDGQHVVGEDRPEGLRLRAGGFDTFGAQLDSQVGCLDEAGGRCNNATEIKADSEEQKRQKLKVVHKVSGSKVTGSEADVGPISALNWKIFMSAAFRPVLQQGAAPFSRSHRLGLDFILATHAEGLT